MKIRRYAFVFLVWSTLPPALCAQSRTVRIDTLSLDAAVAIALENHPTLRSADAALRSASSGETQAMAAYFPTLSASGSLQRTDGAFVLNPSFPPRNQSYNTYTAGLSGQQTLFDFGRTIGRVSAGNHFVDAAYSDYRATKDNVVVNVALAYYGMAQAGQVVRVNEEAVERATQHLKQAKAFYSVGKVAQVDVTKTEVDLANANVNMIVARNQYRLAKLQLDNAMGIFVAGEYTIKDTLGIEPFIMPLDTVINAALRRRPELLAAQARVEANRALVGAAWGQHLPTISAFGNWTWSNFEFPLFSRWNAGVTVTLPLFQGFAISAQVDQARAAADAAQANLDALTQALLLETEQSYLGIKQAEERITAATKLVEQAEENLRLTERQYAAGVGSALNVTDAQLSLSNARITRIQALFDYNSSLIRVKRALGPLSK